MRARSLVVPVLFATALAVAVTTAPAGANVASSVPGQHARSMVQAKACLDNEGPDGGTFVNSQSDGGVAQFGDAAASDFKVDSRCVITVVGVDGYFLNGSGADSFQVLIFKNDRSTGAPGKVVADRDGLAYTYDSTSARLTVHPQRITLTRGSYWIAVIANMSFSEGLWEWETSSTRSGRPDLWENPDGGTCQTWGTFKQCLDVRPANLVVVAGS